MTERNDRVSSTPKSVADVDVPISLEMLKAGAREFLKLYDRELTPEFIVSQIYLEMECVRRNPPPEPFDGIDE